MDLKTVLKALIEDVTLREAFATRALSHARRYDSELTASEYLREYESLLGFGGVVRTTVA